MNTTDSKWLEEKLISSGAFRETDPPVLGTSGIPLFYFVNTEKLLPDNGRWEKYGHDSAAMIQHACAYLENGDFAKVIGILKKFVEARLADTASDWSVSGFQRRDWVFSGPLARLAGKNHLSIYKNGQIKWIQSGESEETPTENFSGRFVHVSDLLTQGSSALNGWIPVFQKNKAKAELFLNVVDRNQGGKSLVEGKGIPCGALFRLDEGFLERHTANPGRCAAYFQNPETAIRDYLENHGAVCFLPFFDPRLNPEKLKRGILFWNEWSRLLPKNQRKRFEEAFSETHGRNFEEFISEHQNPIK